MASIQDIATTYMRLSSREKVRLLARLSHDLTICARGTYLPVADCASDFERLKAFNELQHRNLGQLLAMLSDSVARPDEVFIDMVANSCEEIGCIDALAGLLCQQPVQ